MYISIRSDANTHTYTLRTSVFQADQVTTTKDLREAMCSTGKEGRLQKEKELGVAPEIGVVFSHRTGFFSSCCCLFLTNHSGLSTKYR